MCKEVLKGWPQYQTPGDPKKEPQKIPVLTLLSTCLFLVPIYYIIHQDNAKWLSLPVWSTNESISPSNGPVQLSANSKINYKKRTLRYVTLKDYHSQLYSVYPTSKNV